MPITMRLRSKRYRSVFRVLALKLLFVLDVEAASIRLSEDLEYGRVLFEFYQKDYFSALVEQELNLQQGNRVAASDSSQVLKGGMLMSYGVPDEAQKLFGPLLDSTQSEAVKNSAWFYLSKLYYSKSNAEKSAQALSQIQGTIPDDLHLEYHYLATLININGNHLKQAEQSLDGISEDSKFYPYLLFNLAVGNLRSGNLVLAVEHLEQVANYSGDSEEFLILADRAKHGLAQLAIQSGNLVQAWVYLTGVRTTGLYSNRALLTYAWAAIKLKRFDEAIPALEILNNRSIALPEVQEAKVLLAHLYEQEGAPRKALKSNLVAEKEFKIGIGKVEEARRIIGLRDVPREFIANLDVIMDESQWHSAQPSIDYKKLTPFLIDLMASNAFTEVLKELADLYFLQENLENWLRQAEEHALILNSASQKVFDDNVEESLDKSEELNSRFSDQSSELKLLTLTFDTDIQDRFSALIETTTQELEILKGKIEQLKKLEAPYKQPESYSGMVADHHERLEKQLKTTKQFIATLEPVMRELVNVELNRHEERMRYYWAQSRLAKARLYDSTLLELERAAPKTRENDEDDNE